MFRTIAILFAVAAASVSAQDDMIEMPEGYRAVYMTSNVDTQYVVEAAAVEAGSGVVVNTLAETPTQTWWLMDGETQIMLANTTLCIDAGDSSNWKDMSVVTLEECTEDKESQLWDVMEDGRIALMASSGPQECIDLQYMQAVPNNPVGMYDCMGLGGIGAADAGLNWPLIDIEG